MLLGICDLFIIRGCSLSANSWCHRENWRGFAGGQTGIAVLTNAGQSKDFPIESLGSDQFYVYAIDRNIKVPALYGGFLGAN